MESIPTASIFDQFSFATDNGLTGGEYANFMWHWAHDELDCLFDPGFDKELVVEVYEDFEEANHTS